MFTVTTTAFFSCSPNRDKITHKIQGKSGGVGAFLSPFPSAPIVAKFPCPVFFLHASLDVVLSVAPNTELVTSAFINQWLSATAPTFFV